MLMLGQLPNIKKKKKQSKSLGRYIHTTILEQDLCYCYFLQSLIFPQNLPIANFTSTLFLALSGIILKKHRLFVSRMNNFEGTVHLHMKQTASGFTIIKGMSYSLCASFLLLIRMANHWVTRNYEAMVELEETANLRYVVHILTFLYGLCYSPLC